MGKMYEYTVYVRHKNQLLRMKGSIFMHVFGVELGKSRDIGRW